MNKEINNFNLFQVNDILEFKKIHPCGSKKWLILKTGLDYKLECLGCKRQIIIPRKELNKKIKQ
jgi:hypothetical protein